MDNYIKVVASVIVVTYPSQMYKKADSKQNIEIKAGNDQENTQPERIPTPKTEVGKSLFDNQAATQLPKLNQNIKKNPT